MVFPKRVDEEFGNLKGLIGVDTEDSLVVVQYVRTTDHARVIILAIGFSGARIWAMIGEEESSDPSFIPRSVLTTSVNCSTYPMVVAD